MQSIREGVKLSHSVLTSPLFVMNTIKMIVFLYFRNAIVHLVKILDYNLFCVFHNLLKYFFVSYVHT